MSSFKEEARDCLVSHTALKAAAFFLQEKGGKENRLASNTPNANPQTILCLNIALPFQAVTQTAA